MHTLQAPLTLGEMQKLPRTILVCLRGSSPEAERWRWVREEIESTWGRYLGINFVGFGACEADARGVIVRFEDDCRGRLLSDIETELLDPTKAVPVGICRSYFDSEGVFVPSANEPLTRFLARHQLGHVLHFRGHFSGNGRFDPPSLMRNGIRLSEAAEIQISPDDFKTLRDEIAELSRKPAGALVSMSGKCLTRREDGKLSSELCSVAPALPSAQSWSFDGGKLLGPLPEDAPPCIEASDGQEGSELLTSACAGSQSNWAFAHAQWTSFGRCAFPQTVPPSAGTPLRLGRCEAPGSLNQSWYFDVAGEVDDALVAQIRFSGTGQAGLCVTAPSGTPQRGALLQLQPCQPKAEAQTFRLRHDGSIALGELCVSSSNWAIDDAVSFAYCTPWLVTGALENAAGRAVTIAPIAGATATARTLDGLPTREQVFDFYF